MECRFCGLEKAAIFKGLGEGISGSPLAGHEVGLLGCQLPAAGLLPSSRGTRGKNTS